MLLINYILVLIILFLWGCSGEDCFLYASNLKAENQLNPLGIDVTNPRLSWILSPSNSTCRNQYQQAYRILVASSTTALDKNVGDYWDSNEVIANDTINVIYRGNSVPSRTRVYWKVIIWDTSKHMWDNYNDSSYAWWETPLLSSNDWSAMWIQRQYPRYQIPNASCDYYKSDPVPLFRQEFTLGDRLVSQARLYISGLGYYEAFINGQKVGNNVLDPGFTTYNQSIFYVTYDIATLINSTQTNTIGIVLGNGWYNSLPMLMFGINLRDVMSTGFPATVIAQINVNFVDGSSFVLGTDNTWRVGAGPILFNNIYLGEIYDANLEQDGWSESGFDDSDWPTAVYNIQNQKAARLVAQYIPPIKPFDFLPPSGQWQVENEQRLVFDLGKNFAGWIELNVSNGFPSQSLYMKYGEILFPNRTVNGLTAVAAQIKDPGDGGPCAPAPAYQTDTFILKGLSAPYVESYRQTFTWHAFRYVEITTDEWLTLPDTISVRGIPLHSDLPQIGKFECSNQLYNSIQQMVVNTILSNVFSIQSDCPGRERFGYGGDLHATDQMVMWNFDMSNFYRKRVVDFEEASNYITLMYGYNPQQVIIPEVAPFNGFASAGLGNNTGPIGWATVFPQLQWMLYKFTGDTTLLQSQYQKTKGWGNFLAAYADAHNGTINIGLGDWMAVLAPNSNFSSNVFYRYNFVLLADIAGALGQFDDQLKYLEKADLIKANINLNYMFDEVRYDNGGQAAQSFAIWHDIVPSDLEGYAFNALVNQVAAADNHLTTGMFSVLYLLETLSASGRSDLAFEIINQTTYPGFGYMIMNGSTTVWEAWSFSNDTYSHNHVMFGSVSAWFFEYIAGINQASTSVAFSQLTIQPQVVGDIEWARGDYASVRGNISTYWFLNNSTLCLQVAIPPNTQAVVTLPLQYKDIKHNLQKASITESGIPISHTSLESYFDVDKYAQVFNIGSGEYNFCVSS